MIRTTVLASVLVLAFSAMGEAQQGNQQSVSPGFKYNFGPSISQGQPWYVPRRMLGKVMSGAYQDENRVFSSELDLDHLGWNPVALRDGRPSPVVENWPEVMGVIQAYSNLGGDKALSVQGRKILDAHFGKKGEYYYRCVIECTPSGCFLVCC